MNVSEEQIDNLILSKSYHELTAEEKLSLKDVAATETEFNETKMMLTSIMNQLNEIPEITPNAATKDLLLKEFNRFRPAKAENPAGLGILFPRNKPFHKKLGIQILAVAAVLALIFTLFVPNIGKITDDSDKKDMAIHEEVKTPVYTVNEELPIEKSGEQTLEDSNSNLDESPIKEEVIVSTKKDEQNFQQSTKNKLTSNKELIVSSDKMVGQKEIEYELADGIADEDFEDITMTNVAPAANTDNYETKSIATSGAAVQNDNLISQNERSLAAQEAVNLKSNAKASGKNEAKMNTNLESKSLAQNKELIVLFYTAM